MATKKKQDTMPNLANATPEALVDWLGETREEMNRLKKLEGFYKQALLARMGDDTTCDGEKFSCLIEHSKRVSLDSQAVKDELGDRLSEFQRSTDVTTVRIARKQPNGK